MPGPGVWTVAVLLGTDRHPFDRAVQWTAHAATGSGQAWLLQHGFTAVPADLPSNVRAHQILTGPELTEALATADAVVTHGGPGLIMEARAAGHLPIVVPRDPARGEHVDGHQQDFAARLAADGTILTVDSAEALVDAVQAALADPRPLAGTGGTRPETVSAFTAAVEQARRAPRVTLLQHLRRR